MDDEETRLDRLLSEHQVKQLARVLCELAKVGHGEVTIRVVKGKPSFIRATYERPFYPAMFPPALDSR